MKLERNSLVNQHDCLVLFTDRVSNRNRPMMRCNLCSEFESEASKFSLNRSVPMARGIPVHNSRQLQRVVDHLLSEPHKAAKSIQQKTKLWEMQSTKHPWVRVLKQHTAEVIDALIKLAIDCYNDSLIETLSARSWPARSLAQAHSDRQIKIYADQGWDAPFQSFGSCDSTSSSVYHYRDPEAYSEMLGVIAAEETKALAEQLQKCVSFSLQVDGSVDKQQLDNKFIVVRYLVASKDPELRTAFVCVVEPSECGASGLLESVITALTRIEAPKEKLAGICTDGENANTGQKGGLWKLLSDHLGRKIITVWCTCHRSDLAMEAIETVPEVKIWKLNLRSLATFFRVSKKDTSCLKSLHPLQVAQCINFRNTLRCALHSIFMHLFLRVCITLNGADRLGMKSLKMEAQLRRLRRRDF